MMVYIGYKSSWGVETRKNQQRKDTLVEDTQRPTCSVFAIPISFPCVIFYLLTFN